MNSILPAQQQVSGAAADVQRQMGLLQSRISDQPGSDVSPLMRCFIQRHIQERRHRFPVTISHCKNRHIAVFTITGSGRCAHSDNLYVHFLELLLQLLHHLRDLPYMRKNGLALAKAALSCFNRQEHSGKSHHFPLPVDSSGGSGIATGIKTYSNMHHLSSFFSRSMAPRTPLI